MSKNYFKCECCGQVFLNESSMSTNNKNRCIHCYNFTRQQDIEIFALKTWLKTKENRIDEIRDSFLTKISNLEAKLAEKDKAIENWQTMYQSVMQSCHNGIEEDKRLREQLSEWERDSNATLNEYRAIKYENKQLKQQLAEKEKEIERWKEQYFTEIGALSYAFNQAFVLDKISFAVEQLNETYRLLHEKATSITGTGVNAVRLYTINEVFKSQIEQLTHQHEDKGE